MISWRCPRRHAWANDVQSAESPQGQLQVAFLRAQSGCFHKLGVHILSVSTIWGPYGGHRLLKHGGPRLLKLPSIEARSVDVPERYDCCYHGHDDDLCFQCLHTMIVLVS